MKKILLLIINCLLFATLAVDACELTYDEYKDLGIQSAYIVGEYVFDTSGGLSPSLEDYAIAARSIPKGEEVKVYDIQLFTFGDTVIFNVMEIFSEEISGDSADFPHIDVTYNYRAHIRGASKDDYDIFTCTTDDIDVNYTGILTEGDGEYKTSATRYINILSNKEIASAKYCLTIGESCKPDVETKVDKHSGMLEVEYETNIAAQRVCVEVKNINSLTSGVICDEITVKVDKDYATINKTEKHNEIVFGEPHPLDELFNIEYSVSGGITNYFYYDHDGTKYLLTNLANLPEGNITIEALVRGSNGLIKVETRTITVKKNKVTYNYTENGGIGSSASSLTVGYKGKANLKVTAEKLGYEFIGWNTDPTATSALTSLNVDEDITLYAIFKKEIRANFEIYSLDGNPAVSSASSVSCTLYNKESSCEIMIPVLSAKVGYEVIGWNKNKGAKEAELLGKENVSISDTTTYYSVTRKKVGLTGTFYTIKNGEIQRDIERCYLYNGEDSCRLEGAVTSENYEGRNLIGFTKNSEEPQKQTNFEISTGSIFYAYYEDAYNMQYISGNNSNTQGDTAHVYFVVKEDKISSIVEEKTLKNQQAISGYTPIGWRIDSKLESQEYNQGEKVRIANDIIYYGVYEKSVTINYTADSTTTNIPESQTKKSYYNSAIKKASDVTFYLDEGNGIKKQDHIFASWTNGGSEYAPGSELITQSNITFEANWSLNGCRIVYNYAANGGQRADKSSEVYLFENGGQVDLGNVKAYKMGWKFIGWQTIEDTTAAPLTSIKPNEDDTEIILYAMYEKDVSIDYVLQDNDAYSLLGSPESRCKMNNKDTTCEVTIPEVSAKLNNYEFIGWNTDANATSKIYDAGETISVNDDATYYSITKNNNALTSSYLYYDGNSRKTDTVSCYRYNKSDSCETKSSIKNKSYNGGILTGWSSSDTTISNSSKQVINKNTQFFGVYDCILSVTYNSGINNGTVVNRAVKMNYLTNKSNITALGATITLEEPDGIDQYTTLGWRDDATGGISEFAINSEQIITDNITYNGVYSKKLALTYNSNGGDSTPGMQSKTVYYNTKIADPLVPATFTLASGVNKTGFSFGSWRENSNTGKEYVAGANITIKNNTTMYAKWDVRLYTLTYNYQTNGGSSATSTTKTVPFETLADLTVDAYKNGYEFVGWNTDPTATSALSEYKMPASNVTIYAIYRKAVTATWLITDPLAATLEATTTSCYKYNNNSTCQLKTGNMTAKSAYTVVGWTETQGSIEATTGNNIYIDLGSNKTYYSITKKTNPLVGTFYYYDGALSTITSSTSNCSLFNGASSCILEDTIYKENYDGGTFIGWSNNTNNYTQANMNISSNSNFYAYYEKILQITYHEGLNDTIGKSIATGIKKYITGSSNFTIINPIITLKSPETISNYSIIGWRDDTSAAAKEYSVNQNLTISDSITLYGIYTRVLSLKYNGNGGSTPSTQTVTQYYNSYGNYTSHTFVLAPAATRTGYTFTKWSLNSTSGTQYNASSSINILEDSTMFALWTPNTYTLTYNANGGTVSPSSKIITYDSTYGTLAAPSKYGYTFLGWFSESDGGTQIFNTTKVNQTKNITIYAHWVQNKFTVNFNANGGTVNTSSKEVTYNATYGSLPTPTREHYTFKGWYTSLNGGTLIDSNTFVTTSSDHTLYARWEIDKYSLNISSENTKFGTVTGNSGSIDYGSNVTITAIPKDGYVFAGWYSGTSMVSYDLSYIFTMPANNVTLVAKFSFDITSITNVRVLNVYPGAGNNLATWMNSHGKGIINVTSVNISNFNSNPDTYLGTEGKWNYDVVVFGFYDSNNGKDLSQASATATENFILSGGGVIFGHDTLRNGDRNFWSLSKYVNITSDGIDSQRYTKTIVSKEGIFTTYPYEIGEIGTVLTIPQSHVSNQKAHGDIWLRFGSTLSTSQTNAYLTTYNYCALIQTGHSNGAATADEQKILANLIFYLYSKSVMDKM